MLETEFLIAICPQPGDIRQSKTLFLSIIDLCSAIVDSVFDCRLPGVKVKASLIKKIWKRKKIVKHELWDFHAFETLK